MDQKKIILFFIVILLACCLLWGIPKLYSDWNHSQEINKTYILSNEERETMAAQLFRKNISEGEYIGKVFPEIYTNTTSNEGNLSQKQMNWPNLSDQ